MKNVFRTIVMIALGCVLFASTAAARGHQSGSGRGMGGGGGGMGMGMGGGMNGMGSSGKAR